MNKKFFTYLSTITLISLSTPLVVFSCSENSNTSNSQNIKNLEFTNKSSFVVNTYDDMILTNLNGLGIVTEDMSIQNPSLNNVPNIPLEIWLGAKGQDARSAFMISSYNDKTLKTNKMPNDFIGLKYTRNSNDDFFEQNRTWGSSNLINDGQGNYYFGDHGFPAFEGIIEFRNCKENKQTNSLNLFATIEQKNYSTLQNNYDKNLLPTINNYKKLPNYSMNDKQKDGWIRSTFTFAIFDAKLWFTNTSSSMKIKLNSNIELPKISVDDFVNNIEKYITVEFFNTPSQCISENSNNSKLEINKDDKNLIIKSKSLTSFKPNYNRNSNKDLVSDQWIINNSMEDVLKIPLKSFLNSENN